MEDWISDLMHRHGMTSRKGFYFMGARGAKLGVPATTCQGNPFTREHRINRVTTRYDQQGNSI